MRIEQVAQHCRWQTVAPQAKLVFAVAGMLAAALSPSVQVTLLVAAVLAGVTLAGARVALRDYLAVAFAPMGFLATSCLTMLVAVDLGEAGMGLHWQPQSIPLVTATIARSLAMLAAVLGLVLTTPLTDLLPLMRRAHLPEILIDMMVLSYRMLFVFIQAWDESVTAQRARLGYHSWASAIRSLGQLGGTMAVQVWQRARALQVAADARCYDGTLRFLPSDFPHAMRETTLAALAGLALMLGAWSLGVRMSAAPQAPKQARTAAHCTEVFL